MSRTHQHTGILEAMQMVGQPMRSRDIRDMYENIYGSKLLSISGRLSELNVNGYIDKFRILKKEDPDNVGVWYVLTELGSQPGIVPICNLRADGFKRLRSSREESEVKKLNKELNTTLLECPPPPVRSSLLKRFISLFK